MDNQKRLEEIKKQHGWLDNTNHSDAGLGYCGKCWLISQVRSLQAELDAWKSAFGNQQLADASVNYEAQLQKVSALRSRCSTLDRRLGEAESALAKEREEKEGLQSQLESRVKMALDAGRGIGEAVGELALRAANARVEKLERALKAMGLSLAWNTTERVWFLNMKENPQVIIEQALAEEKVKP